MMNNLVHKKDKKTEDSITKDARNLLDAICKKIFGSGMHPSDLAK